MQILELNQIAEWCEQHSIVLDDNWHLDSPSPSVVSATMFYAEDRRSGREPAVARECAQALGEWAECLLWVVQWGVWPSGEDWPTYYALRGSFGERRSLTTAPGHLFSSGEEQPFINFLTLVLENAWDAHVLPVARGASLETSAFVSHDGWVDLYGSH